MTEPNRGTPPRAAGLADKRRFRRYPIWIDATLRRSDGSGERASALLVDISMGGGLVRSLSGGFAVGDSVAVAVQPRSEEIRGNVLRVERTWTGTLYHLQFRDLSSSEERALLQLLDVCRPEFEAHQRYLAARHDTGRAARGPLEPEG